MRIDLVSFSRLMAFFIAHANLSVQHTHVCLCLLQS